MILNVINEDKYKLGINSDMQLICQLVDKELGVLKGNVNLIYCNDKTIRQLNKEYRKKDAITDVLTFNYYEERFYQDLSEAKGAVPPCQGGLGGSGGRASDNYLLGEILIDIPQARRQAKDTGCSLEMELYKLFAHGVLHLRGFDHEKGEDFRVMKLLEDKIMESFETSR